MLVSILCRLVLEIFQSFVSKFCAFSLFFVVSFVEMKDHVAHLALIQDFK